MNALNRNRYDMLIKVRNFGAAHGRLFPEHSTAHAAFSIVATEVAQIEALAVTEEVASQSARVARNRDARTQLVEALIRAANTARVLSGTIPELTPHAYVPAGTSDRQLLTLARAFARAATPYVAQFAAHGIVVEGLADLIEAFETAVHERGTRRDELAQTRGRLDEALKRALQAVKTLDVTVTNTLANNPVALAAWKRDRRVGRVKRLRVVAPLTPQAAVTPDAVSEQAKDSAAEKAA